MDSFFLPLSPSSWGHLQEKELLLCLGELPEGDEDRDEAIEDEDDEEEEGDGEEPVEELELKAPRGTFTLICL